MQKLKNATTAAAPRKNSLFKLIHFLFYSPSSLSQKNQGNSATPEPGAIAKTAVDEL
jgi:hypothetical protein